MRYPPRFKDARVAECTVCHKLFPHKEFKKWRAACAKCRAIEHRRQNSKPSQKIKKLATRVSTQYGITLEDYYRMQEEQNNLCAICKQPETARSRIGETRRLGVDHDHKTGKARQLLCNACNHLLGNAHEDSAILQACIDYLKKHEDKSLAVAA